MNTNLVKLFVVLAMLLTAELATAQLQPSQDASRTGTVHRGMILPRVESTKTGIRITIDTYTWSANEKINLKLQLAVAPQKNVFSSTIVNLADLLNPVSEKTFQNGKQLKFDLTFEELNDSLHKIIPNAPHLKVGPGTPLLVYARWASGHQWGGTDRGGLVNIPGDAQDSSIEVIRPTGLDVAATIDGNLANRYQVFNSKLGLKKGGQIRSRVEGEGKFQVYQNQLVDLKKKLFEIANDPTKAQKVLGPEWSIKVEDRYMKRDESGNLILAEDGFPIPDPMVDTYYDNVDYDAAKKDMAIRYRWTEGNQTGAWNIKPGIGRSSPEGVMYRLESGVDTTSDRPSAVARFADSEEALNPFRKIRQLTGKRPSSFLKPSVKIVDQRYKFKLQHNNGLIIEVSLDDATAENLRAAEKQFTKFAQLEMDIDHLATQSTASITPKVGGNSQLAYSDPRYFTQFQDQAVIKGGISLHDESDLEENGAVISQHAQDFDLATEVIVKLRKTLLGSNWMPGAQKYAIAAEKLGVVSEAEASKSVKDLHEKEKLSSKVLLLKFLEGDLTHEQLQSVSPSVVGGMCKELFAKK